MKRPMIIFAVTLITGILSAKITNSYDFIILSSILLLALLLIFIIFVKIERTYNTAFVIIGMLAFYLIGGSEYLHLDRKIKEKFINYAGEQVIIRGVINSEVEVEDDKITFIVLSEEVAKDGADYETIKGNIRLTVIRSRNATKTDSTVNTDNTVETGNAVTASDRLDINRLEISNNSMAESQVPIGFDFGAKIKVTGMLSIPTGMRNPGGFDYRSYLAISGVSATMYIKENSIIAEDVDEKRMFLRFGNAVRKSIVRVINSSLEPKQAGLLNAMLTGYRGGVVKDIETAFSDSGLSHILSVSGLHVVFVMLPFMFLFKEIGLKKVLINAFIILILIFYLSITGMQPSVLRAVIMAVTLLAGQIIWREADTLTSMSLACIILLTANPHILFSIGFQLSFTATLAIVLFNMNVNKILVKVVKLIFKYNIEYRNNHATLVKNRLNPKLKPGEVFILKIRNYFCKERIIKQAVGVLSTTISAQAGVLPLAVMYFNEISLVSIISNLLVAPFTGIIMILGLIMAIIGHISLDISRIIGIVNNVFINIVIYISEVSAKMPFAVLKAGISSMLIIIIYYVLVWFFLWFKPKHKIKIKKIIYIYSAICITLVIIIVSLIPGQLEVTFLDVGSGDSIFIRTQWGKTILIDGGGENGNQENQADIGEKIIIPFLLDNGVTKLNLLIATHGHADHIQGLNSVLEQLKVGNAILPDYKEKDELDKIIDICKDRNINITYCKEGDNIYLDKDTYFKVLNPPLKKNQVKKGEASLNNNSLVINLIYKNVKMLFTGDIEKETEELLINNYQDVITDIHVLKVPHHGSDTSSTMEFIELARPVAAVISVGKNNYGHPSDDVLRGYGDIGAKIYRTDKNGAVMIKTNGKTIKVKVMFDNEY